MCKSAELISDIDNFRSCILAFFHFFYFSFIACCASANVDALGFREFCFLRSAKTNCISHAAVAGSARDLLRVVGGALERINVDAAVVKKIHFAIFD